MDRGHRDAERQLRKLTKSLYRTYDSAYREMEKKLSDYLQKFADKDEAKRLLVDSGEMTEEAYKAWRESQILRSKSMQGMIHDMAVEMNGVNQSASAIVNDAIVDAFVSNYNYGAYEVSKGVGVMCNFDLVDRATVERLAKKNPKLLPEYHPKNSKDIRWNEKKIRQCLTQGIVQGDSIDNLSKRLRISTDMNRETSIRAARTMTTSAESAGRIEVYEEAEEMGIDVEKTWMAIMDKHTRDEHAELDGVTIPLDEKFENSIGEIDFPADPTADPANVYNCRCTLVATVKGRKRDFTQRNNPAMGDMTYDQWKEEAHERALERKSAREARAEHGTGEENANKENTEKSNDYGKRSVAELSAPVRPSKDDFKLPNGDFDDNGFDDARKAYREEKDEYQKQIEDAVNATMERIAFETPEQAINWANNMNIEIDKEMFKDIDIRFFNDIKPALEEMNEKFPEVFHYKIEAPDGSFVDFNFRIGTVDSKATEFMTANGGLNIQIHGGVGKDYRSGTEDMLSSMLSGCNVLGDGTMETVIRHEFGHNVDEYIRTQIANEYHPFVNNWKDKFSSKEEWQLAKTEYREKLDAYEKDLLSLANLSGASDYSNFNSLELFAEGFAEYSSGGKTEFGLKFGEFLERWYK